MAADEAPTGLGGDYTAAITEETEENGRKSSCATGGTVHGKRGLFCRTIY